MTGLMPTRDGDIVIAHQQESRSMYSVWRVTRDAQQECGITDSSAAAMGRAGALMLAASMAAESRGAIFFLDPDSAVWTKIDA